jgi:hypothetical protein
MLISNMFIYKSFDEKKKKNLQNIIVVQMYEIVATLILGSRPKQGLTKVRSRNEA